MSGLIQTVCVNPYQSSFSKTWLVITLLFESFRVTVPFPLFEEKVKESTCHTSLIEISSHSTSRILKQTLTHNGHIPRVESSVGQ